MKTLTCDHCGVAKDARSLDPKTNKAPIQCVKIQGVNPSGEIILDLCTACVPLFKNFVATFVKKA
jgi:hypothetical protein